jgi:HJR/Mrr/RecB family endonuclease
MKKVRNCLLILWSVFICCGLIYSRNEDNFPSIVAGVLMIWCIGDFLVYMVFFIIKSIRLSILKNKIGKEQKKIEGLQKEYDKQLEKINLSNDLQKKVERANELAEIINKTTDRVVFYSGLNEIKNILRDLISYEGLVDFVTSPAEDLKQIEKGEPKQIELLEKRIQEKNVSLHHNNYQAEIVEISNNDRPIKRSLNSGMMNGKQILVVDPLFVDAGRLIIEKEKASIGMLQRMFKIGFNRAARIMDQLCDAGVVGPEEGPCLRKILMNADVFDELAQNVIFSETVCQEIIQKKSCLSLEENRRIDLYNNKYDYMDGHDFERYCASVLEKNGFSDVSVTPGSGDQGIDVIAYKDGVKYGIQCKCYSSDIGNKAVQEAFSGAKFYECHVPVVLTNRYFTKSAKELAEKANVLLWDRDKLNTLIGID